MTLGIGSFPSTRLRRNRQHPWTRALVAEHRLVTQDLIWPLFIQEGKDTRTPIASMPGIHRLTLDIVVEEAKHAHHLGIPAIALFPVVEQPLKSLLADEAYNPHNLVCRAIEAIKAAVPELGIICDIALDPYTSHGHDGIVRNDSVDNDATIEILCKQALALAKAGCDIVAPSDMMDGRVGALRTALDKHHLTHVSILSYAAKYASSFYGPFRDAIGSASNLGKADKRTYQMDPANASEALREVALDIAEGADMVMVKPGMPYLDIIRTVKDRFSVPVFAYQVSGEYAMLQAAHERGFLNFTDVMQESLLCFKRAGATGIFTYAALEIAQVLKSQR